MALVASVALLACGGAAQAGERARVQLTRADQAAARATDLQRSDFAGLRGWTGRRATPDLGDVPTCPGFNPRQADLVVTGASASTYRDSGGAYVTSQVHVLRTARMLRLDWQRTVRHPGFLRCLRTTTERQLGPGQQLVSARRLRLPRLAPYADGLRFVVEFALGGRKQRMVVDTLLLGRGRTEIGLGAAAPLSARAALERTELRLARRLVARARA